MRVTREHFDIGQLCRERFGKEAVGLLINDRIGVVAVADVMPRLDTFAVFLALLAMQLMPGPETMLVISRGIGQG
jgi:hypothetical protein